MKVIDFHVHIGSVKIWTPWVKEFFRENNPGYFDRFAESLRAEEVIDIFTSQGVDRIVMLAEYAPKCTGVVTNDETARFCRDHEELIPFAALCLEDSTPYVEQARHAVEDLGMKGFKLLPSYQHFYPNDLSFFPFYDYVQSKGLPVMFHTGTSIFKGTRIKYADPLLLDDVADEFPDLTIIMEHGGRPFWYDRAAWMICRHRNVHIGIAGIATRHLPRLFPNLEKFPDRFVFGSDWPGMADVKGLVDRVLALPYSDETKEAILHGNAERLLGKGSVVRC
jgi:predicted TIM-barrel fold metal-dependent hydrolase